MIGRFTNRKGILVASGVLSIIAVTLFSLVAFTGQATTPTLPDPLPPMTLTYEVHGDSVSVGGEGIAAFKETRRLEYRSQTDWKEIVTESPTLDLGRYGTGSNEGSYRQLKGNTETIYDALTDTTTTYTLGGTSVHLPTRSLAYAYHGMQPLGPNVVGDATTANIRVCSADGTCLDSVSVIKYAKGDGDLVVYAGSDFILPVKDGDVFTLKSVQINGP